MKFLIEFIKFFVYISTGVLIICSLNFLLLSESKELPKDTLLQILLSGAITAFITTLFYKYEAANLKQFLIMTAIHYICLCAAIVFLGVIFEWISIDIYGILIMMVSVAVVYFFTFFGRYFTDKKEADALNKALEKKYKN